MAIPEYRIDYTKATQDVYNHALWKGYKFRKGRNLDSWLSFAWSMLFQRKMTPFDLMALKSFLEKKKALDLKIKCNQKLNYEDQMFKTQYVGKDGYIYMNKMVNRLEMTNPKETARLNKKLEEYSEAREKRFEEYEKRCLKEMSQKAYINNHYIVKGNKIYRR